MTELPVSISDKSWSSSVLRVLEKAAQSRPENRYQTVEDFWDEFAEASLPPTRPLRPVTTEMDSHRKPSEDLSIEA